MLLKASGISLSQMQHVPFYMAILRQSKILYINKVYFPFPSFVSKKYEIKITFRSKRGQDCFQASNCYRQQTKFAKVMFLHLSVILSTRGAWSWGGVCLSAC